MNRAISSLRRWVFAAVAGYFLAFSSASSAAAFQVTFDPYTELYGLATFNVNPSCLASNNNYDTLAELIQLALNGCYITFEGAHISTDGINGTFTDYISDFPLVIFSSLLVANNQLAGLTTFIPIFLEPVGVTQVAALSFQSSFSFGCHETLSFTAPSAQNPAGGVSFTGCQNGQSLQPLTGNVISIAQVPEPGTLALVLGAGVAGWWSRRRRRAAA